MPTPRRTPERRSPAVASDLARYLTELATGVSVPPWADFVDTATRAVFGTKGFTTRRNGRELDLIERWRNLREPVLTELAALGLEATVRRVDQDMPVGEHHADLAGLVTLHHPGHPGTRYDPEPYDRAEVAYQHRMYARHGLRPHRGLPDAPRGFCGQSVTHHHDGRPVVVERPPPWFDHTRTWIDHDGLPVLTVEVYLSATHNPLRNPLGDPGDCELMASDVLPGHRHFVHLDPVPLRITGPPALPGVWNDHTHLLLMRWEPDAEAPPAEATPRRLWVDLPSDDDWDEGERTMAWLTPDEWTRAEIDRHRNWGAA